ncbi:MAG: methyltransferase [Erysipelothrix sp.]|nr:methyltransferase [Erysipelothrix sp.]
MIKSIEEYAKKHRVPIINQEGLDFLIKQIEKYKVNDILELGSAIGYSAIMMSNIHDNIKIVTIEKDEERYHEAVNNIDKLAKQSQIQIHLADALEFETNDKFDMIFLDLAKSRYEAMLNKFYPNLNNGGIVIVDNLGMYGLVYETDLKALKVKRRVRQLIEKIIHFREAIANDERFEVTFYDDIGDGIAIIKKKGD